MASRPVVIAAGGTGGHVFPALAVATALREKNIPVVWIGTERGIESRLVPEWGFPIRMIRVSALRGNGMIARIRGVINLVSALASSCGILYRERPRTILGMGGYVAGPVCLAARLCGRRMVLHEQNAVAGFTNRILKRFADRVMQAMPDTFAASDRVVYTGNPVRQDILVLPPPAARFEQRGGALRVLVIGGSQGARVLNETVPASLQHVEHSIRVRHQTGKLLKVETEAAYAGSAHEAEVTAFIENMAEAYAWADLIICRSGAMTVAEIAATGLAAILVPFPSAVDDHQTANGRFLVDAGAAIMIQEKVLTPELLGSELSKLAGNRATLLNMARKGREAARRDATQLVMREILGESA